MKQPTMVNYSYHRMQPYVPSIGEYAEYYQGSLFRGGQLSAFRHCPFSTLIKSVLPMLEKLGTSAELTQVKVVLAIDHDVCCVSVRLMHKARDGCQGRRSRSGPPSRAECMSLTDTQHNRVINRSSTTLVHNYKHFNCQFTTEWATN